MKYIKLNLYYTLFRSVAIQLIRLGIDPRKLSQLRYCLRFFRERSEWKDKGGQITKNDMVLSEYGKPAGIAKGHYFHQDLLVAQSIFIRNPKRHIDIASRIDGFVAHVASFRKIEVVDVRPLPNSEHINIQFLQADLTKKTNIGITDSLSCLHALEHFGLGRYSDPINVEGHIIGITNMINMISKGGRLYISVPVGTQDEVHFNAHRVFALKTIPDLPIVQNNMVLERFDLVDDNGKLFLDENIEMTQLDIIFGCGIYTFVKKTDISGS